MLHSYELLARYVMPQFQGTALGTASNTWAYEWRELLLAGRTIRSGMPGKGLDPLHASTIPSCPSGQDWGGTHGSWRLAEANTTLRRTECR
jgi:hypothetical protein